MKSSPVVLIEENENGVQWSRNGSDAAFKAEGTQFDYQANCFQTHYLTNEKINFGLCFMFDF